MELGREAIEQIARATAREVVNNLHRYAVIYQTPASVPEGLLESMGEELTASNWYRERAKDARDKGDHQSANRYEEIARDEDEHYREFSEELKRYQ